MVLGGNMKDSASGKMPDNGLSEKKSFANESPASMGMDSKGPDQKPIGVVKGSVNTSHGKFETA
tara:strand:- start:5512 stop:5703 length:192 start_codon:yes stop_codon:yes gene_type:complete